MAKKRKMARGTAQKGGMPPKHTQFRKGTSGNPRGRPKGSKNLSTYLMEAARDQVTATVGGRTRTISKLQATTMQLATKAAGGDQAAIGRFLDWVDEIETRAASVKPSQFPIGAPDIEVIRAVYGRMKQCDPKKNVRNKMAPTPANMYADVLRHDLCAFIHRSFLELNAREEFLFNWHIERLAAKLEEVRRGSCKRLIVNLPPRHLKSHVISIVFPAWLLGHDPGKQILSVTYAQDFSDNLARKSRTLMTSPFYEGLFDTRLSKGREAVSDFETTDGGTRFSTSVGGVLTGRGADIIIIDDPLKADDALSEPRRRSVNEWFDNTLRSRLNSQEKGVIIIVMQRLHADDLVAHVQQHESWDVLSFPAIAELDETYDFLTPYGRRRIHRKTGEILQPSLLSPTALESQRRGMTEYNFVAQYQQDPQPPSGIIVKREWLKFYDPSDLPKQFDQIFQSWDTANKDTELSNFSVCTTWGLKDRRLFLLDVYRHKLEFPALKRAVRDLAALHRAKIVLIEDKASWPAPGSEDTELARIIYDGVDFGR